MEKKIKKNSEFAADGQIPEQTSPKKVAVIVGASSGIGYHTALSLTRENYTVYNISRTRAKVKTIQSVCADACKPGAITAAIRTILESEKRIDVFIYSAGWSLASPLEHITDTDLRKLFDTNFFGLIESLKAVIPVMREQKEGRIIAVSSMAGSTPVPFDAPYSASKAAIDMTMRTLAIELYPYNIKVSSVAPGGVATHFTFKRKVYSSDKVGVYAECMQKAVEKLGDKEQSGQDPRSVANEIVSLLSVKNPPALTAVGIKNKATKMMTKFLPSSLSDYMNRMAWE